MDIQLVATDEELREFPETESKTDSTVLDKTPSSKSINLIRHLTYLNHITLTCLEFKLAFLTANLAVNPGEATDTDLTDPDPKIVLWVIRQFRQMTPYIL